ASYKLPTIFGLSWLAIYASLRFAVPGGMAAESERICGGLAQFKNQQSSIVNNTQSSTSSQQPHAMNGLTTLRSVQAVATSS
ncbi:MAG: hypothetical protein ACK56K_03015, partial [Akkermansiaceae bacterium]